MEKFKVIFYPDNKSVEAEKDRTILSAALSAGVYINSACGGDGVCGKCKVIVKSGEVSSPATGAVSIEEKERGVYLACLATIHSNLEVEIPPSSRLVFEEGNQNASGLKGLYSKSEVMEDIYGSLAERDFKHAPLVTKAFLELPLPTLEDRISDLERLCREIKKRENLPILQGGITNIRQLSNLLRDAEWKVTATLGKRNDTLEIISVEPGDTSCKNFGIAFDIGTTTISGQLVDLNNKLITGTRITYNKQAVFGSDVISRIIYSQSEGGLERLHNTVITTINQIIRELAEEHKVDFNDLTCIIFAGNTTMIHLLMSIDPSQIRRHPYVPTANFIPTIKASEIGININPRGLLTCVPGVSSYLGGDITAGVLAAGMNDSKEISLLIDIGTNGEIVLGNCDFLVGCAASAGPAFEGTGVSCGMRVSRGAIEKISIDKNKGNFNVEYKTVNDEKPLGICGSGYINLLSQLLSVGLIDKDGKIKPASTPRIRKTDNQMEFVVVFAEDSATGKDIVITEADIENLKRAKGAIYSAVATLVKHMDMKFSQIEKVFIAGGFGTYLDVDKAIDIGLLPDLDRSRFIFIGNSALAGARTILLSYEALKKAEEIARQITYFELSIDSSYMDEYIAALFFPHTNLSNFPSVRY